MSKLGEQKQTSQRSGHTKYNCVHDVRSCASPLFIHLQSRAPMHVAGLIKENLILSYLTHTFTLIVKLHLMRKYGRKRRRGWRGEKVFT